MQTNNTKFWVEFDDFQIGHCKLDGKGYHFGSVADEVNSLSPECDDYKREQTFNVKNDPSSYIEYFSITSVGNTTTSLLTKGSMILIRPMYLGTLEEKKKDRNSECRFVHDRLYSGFYAFNMGEDGACARETKSGWWFPHQVHKTQMGDQWRINGNCDYRREKDTNLNGMFHEDPEINGRAIMLCAMPNSKDCYVQNFDPNSYCVGQWGVKTDYEFKGLITIKLTTTKMYMYRRRL